MGWLHLDHIMLICLKVVDGFSFIVTLAYRRWTDGQAESLIFTWFFVVAAAAAAYRLLHVALTVFIHRDRFILFALKHR